MTRPASRTGVGASSILLIIVVVCLTLFGVLAFVSARNDAALTTRTAAAAQAYYEADAAAQRALSAVDAWLLSGGAGEPEGVTLIREGDTASFSISSSDGHALQVTLSLAGGRCAVTGYRYLPDGEWSAEPEPELFH